MQTNYIVPNEILHARLPLVRVEAIETSNGIKTGDRVYFGGYKTIKGDIEPLVPCTVESVTYHLGCLSYYRLQCTADSGYSFSRVEAAEHCFRKME